MVEENKQEPMNKIVIGSKKFFEILGSHLGIKPDFLMKEFENKRTHYIGLLDKWHENIGNFVSNKKEIEILKEFYQLNNNENNQLSLYNVKVGEDLVETALLSQPKWLGLKIPLDNENNWVYNRNHMQSIPPLINNIELLADSLNKAYLSISSSVCWDDPVFDLIDCKINDNINANFALTYYYLYRFTIRLLEDELKYALVHFEGNIEDILNNMDDCLPIRKLLLPNIESFTNINNRVCCGGPAITFARARSKGYKDKKDYEILLVKRSRRVANSPEKVSVCPMGFHQPFVKNFADCVTLESTAMRELGEELFGLKELRRGAFRYLTKEGYFNNLKETHFNDLKETDFKWFLNKIIKNNYLYICTSFGFNLVHGNYEFGVLLVITEEDKELNLKLNWENLPDRSHKIEDAELISSLDKERISKVIHEFNWSSESLVSFIEGLKCLEKLDKKRVNLPEIVRIF